MKKILLFTAFAAFLSAAATAKSEHEIKHSFTIDSQQSLDISFPVGSLEINTHEGNEIKVSIELEEKSNGWFDNSDNLDELTLDSEQTANKLTLTLDNDDVQQTWLVSMPRSLAVNVDLGVGDIEINDFANSADIEVDVGAVRIDSQSDDYKYINLDSGVGDTRISGLKNTAKSSRKMVSSQSEYSGNGTHTVKVEVGVGDIKLKH
ncbi:hypothetical protein NQT69_14640 [Pseudoalteromonas shioyasakiensis]|uniref:hypothetical protein n=1 Tax=Pseudoalteromonas shioyasakiensis TaxID=1190813 RepID=UPI0021189965|nr:hypothetical protein [Pseudoalteromonas shioyasakiensis]MCQ8879246.1 hypothetical protein [Pseudoalteromonas shioyasakiensis]